MIFRVFFVPLKQFLQFLELFLALKINSKKNYSSGLGRAYGPTQPTRAHAGPAGQARQAHRPAMAAAASGRDCPARVAIKEEAEP
jgi:hypothetical protein